VRSKIVLVPQEGHLFGGTIAENVRLAAPEAGNHEVEQALRAIGALDRFAGLPDGLETEVHSRGSRLSAGERQFVGLARIALADPEVLILDEATSSLDPGTARAVEDAVGRLTEGRTVITIAHRLSTARLAAAGHDLVLVDIESPAGLGDFRYLHRVAWRIRHDPGHRLGGGEAFAQRRLRLKSRSELPMLGRLGGLTRQGALEVVPTSCLRR
jgi:ABC-type transport system involved in cytochrome bd biosynthesis fused ATPase/permease subunit